MLVTPRPSVAPPPPCWCGLSWRAHEEPPHEEPPHEEPSARNGAPDHEYVPADGIESEAFDAW
jgi:hypothetical protein